MPKQLSPWSHEAKEHLLKYRPKMAAELQSQGSLDDWAQNAANRAVEESARSIENGMSCLDAQREAKLNHYLLPSEEDVPHLGENPQASPDPASLVTTTGSRKPTTSGKAAPPRSLSSTSQPSAFSRNSKPPGG